MLTAGFFNNSENFQFFINFNSKSEGVTHQRIGQAKHTHLPAKNTVFFAILIRLLGLLAFYLHSHPWFRLFVWLRLE
ncbi:MAG: hypothetical protein MJE63_30250, partial [Proteobacteria bacterium]|nr:hypothetical protein [Pseudomonadota bacterium]